MRSTLAAILILALAACGDDGPVIVSDPAEMRVVKVSGDQSAPVPAVAPSRIVAVAGTSLDAVPGDGWTPEPLVARVVPEATAGRGITGSGPVIPAGTLVHWQIPEGAGRIYGQTTATDDSAYVVNRWAPGTRAGTYTVAAGRLVGSDIVTDATWEVVVEPGPVAEVYMAQVNSGPLPVVATGDTLDARSFVPHGWDAHRNEVPGDVIGALPDSLVTWTLSDNVHNATADPIHGHGWDIVVPQLDGWYVNTHDPGIGPHYRVRLQVFIEGAKTTESSYFIVPIDS